jgi:hypothetical protein
MDDSIPPDSVCEIGAAEHPEETGKIDPAFITPKPTESRGRNPNRTLIPP